MPDKAIIFYDGRCGLCHGLVKFVLKRDKNQNFQFSPLKGEEIKKHLDADIISKLPDSVVVYNTDGKIYLKSYAILLVLEKLGGIWSALTKACIVFPMRFKNKVYDFIAGTRYKLFSERTDSCPVLPPEFKQRFLA